jgi:hypothetical protein
MQAQRFLQHHLPRRIIEMFVPPQHERDLHECIVYRGGEIVERSTGRFHHDEIADRVVIEGHAAFDQILDDRRAGVDGKVDRVRASGGFELHPLPIGEIAATPGVARRLDSTRLLLVTIGFEFF